MLPVMEIILLVTEVFFLSLSSLSPHSPPSDNFFFFSGSYPADKNVNLMIKKGESLSFLSKKKDNFTMVEIDLSDQVCSFLSLCPPFFIFKIIPFFFSSQTVPFLTSMSDSKVAIDSYKYSHHDSGHILDFTVIFFIFFIFFFVPSSHNCSLQEWRKIRSQKL